MAKMNRAASRCTLAIAALLFQNRIGIEKLDDEEKKKVTRRLQATTTTTTTT